MAIFRYKKGFIMDLIVMCVVCLAIGLVIVLGLKVQDGINTKFQSDTSNSAAGLAVMQNITDRYPSNWDFVFGFVFLGISIAIIASAYFIDTTPILLPFLIIVLFILIYVSGALSNAYYAFATADGIAEYAQRFIILSFVLLHWPLYLAVEGSLTLIALFAKITQM
jgi:signal transduction histidine kinase